jgi:hypothetical protein
MRGIEMRSCAVVLIVNLLLVGSATAETVTIEARRDATLIEDPDGTSANGSGPALFVGRTNQAQNGVRRSLLYFDVAAALPRRAIVTDAVLTLFMLPSNPASRTMTLLRLRSDWGEGPSVSSGGSGAAAQAGDATWLHTFFDGGFWVRSGGDFIGRVSAELEVADSGLYSWQGGRRLVRDIQLWNTMPQRNFGWILIGDEDTRQTAKSFASREASDPGLRPVLAVSYRMPGDGRPSQ